MDILKQSWSSALNIRAVLISLVSLLSNPNPDDPLNHDLAKLYRKNIEDYNNYVKCQCEKNAIKCRS